MKKIMILALSVLLAAPALFAQSKTGVSDTQKHAKFYACPHHPEMTSDKPGKCPTCGMDLALSSKEEMKRSVTKNYNCPVHLDVTSHDPGQCPRCGKKMDLSPKEQMKAEVTRRYTCPMHPGVALNKDGICPKCGKKPVAQTQKN